jgi:hypothetical protein
MQQCKCGCGQQTKLITKTAKKQGRIKGLPNDFVWGHNQSFWGKVGEKMKREENLVPAGFRERKTWFNEKPRTYEQILTAEQEAAERTRLAEEQKAAQKAAEEESFTKKKEAAEAQYTARFNRSKRHEDEQQ